MTRDKSRLDKTMRTLICCAKIGGGHWFAPIAAQAAIAFAADSVGIKIKEFEAFLESAEGAATLVLPIANTARESAAELFGAIS